MASLQLTVQPFDIPTSVYIEVPNAGSIPIPIEDLDEETLGQMVEEFAAAVMAKAKAQ